MSKIAFKPNESGTATFEIQAPATNTNRTLTLPDSAGELLNDQSDIEPQVKAATNASGNAPIYACRAWVNFNGTTTTPTIRASGNVSSVTRTSTGNYTVNFTNAMPDANYATAIKSGNTGSISRYQTNTPQSTTNVLVATLDIGFNFTNSPNISVAIFR